MKLRVERGNVIAVPLAKAAGDHRTHAASEDEVPASVQAKVVRDHS